jgi:DNA-binding ferritin-like protein
MAEQPRNLLKRNPDVVKSSAPEKGYVGGNLEQMVAACVSELMNAATSFHKLHLKVTAAGSFAAHSALKDLYDALPGHADDLAEGFQGAAEMLLKYNDDAPKTLNTVEDGLRYMRMLTDMVDGLQAKMPYSELVNDLDTIKSTINSAKYKLLFLK